MLGSTVSATAKRAAFRAGLASGRLQRMPGAFSPLVARVVQEAGFEGVYVSGAVLSLLRDRDLCSCVVRFVVSPHVVSQVVAGHLGLLPPELGPLEFVAGSNIR